MKTLKQIVLLLIVCPILFIFSYPLLWLITACFKSNREIYKPLVLFPKEWNTSYFADLFSGKVIDFWGFMTNSLFTTTIQSLIAVFLSASVAYIFVFKEFKLKRAIFILAVSLILIPKQIMIFPLRELIFKMNLNDSLWAIILPGALSGIGILFFIQVYRSLPRDYVDFAKVEGASDTKIFLTTLPLILSPLLCCFMIHFILAWQQHLMPLLLLNDNQLLPVAMSSLLTSSLSYPLAVLMCAALMCILPSTILFLFTYKNFRSTLSEQVI
ncbi:MAG: carbohydrate ABC transporter permease [Lentisphaeraceae bacterium]|nr:carbohydrate ABC transporter permease [Lentisphaeraceae bacterium]